MHTSPHTPTPTPHPHLPTHPQPNAVQQRDDQTLGRERSIAAVMRRLPSPACSCACSRAANGDDHGVYGYIASGPIAWMAPETFDGRMPSRTASTAGDVYMLGSTFLEVISGCTRTPFDWLPARGVFNYRGHEVSRQVNTVEAALEAGKPYTSAGAVCVDCPHCEAGTVYPGGSLRVD